METNQSKRKYIITGGKTIIGRIFSYQEKTGMTIKEILEMPYIMFILGVLDAPAIDYEDKKEKVHVPKTEKEEINALVNFLK